MAEQVLRLLVGLDTARAKAETDQYAQHLAQAQQRVNQQADGLRQQTEQAQAAAAQREEARQKELATASLGRAQQLIEQRKQLAVAAISDEGKRRQAQIQLQYTTELETVRKLLAVRKQAGEITARQYLDELRRFEAQLSSVRDNRLSSVSASTSQALGGVADSGSRANQVVQSFGYLVNDAQQAQYGFRQAIVATSNNLPIFLQQIGDMGRAAKASGTTLTASLVGSLTGVGGLIAILNLAATAFVLFGDKGTKAVDDVAERAENAKEKIDSLLSTILDFNNTPLKFEVEAQNVDGLLSTFEARVRQTRSLLAADDQAARERSARDAGRGRQLGANINAPGAGGGRTQNADAAERSREAVREEVALTQAERVALEGQLAIQEGIVGQLKQQQELQRGLADVSAELQSAGLEGETDESRRSRDKAPRDAATESRRAGRRAETETRREQRRTEAERVAAAKATGSLIADLRVATIEGEIARERAVLAAWYTEKLAIAGGNAEAITLVETERAQRSAEIDRKEREQTRRALEEQFEIDQAYAKLAGATAEEVAEARIQQIDEYIAAEEAAGGDITALLADRERALLARDQAAAESAKKRAEIEEQTAKRIEAVEERRRRLAGATDEEILASRLAVLSLELAAFTTTAERKLEIEAELAETRIELEEKVAKAAELAEQRKIRAAERYVGSVLDALGDELTRKRQFSDADVRATEEDLQAKRRAIEDDLERRVISEERAARKIREIDAELAAFRKDVAEDQRDVIGAVLTSLTDLFRQAAKDAIAAELAKAVAAQIAKVIISVPFPFNLLAVGGAVAATTALSALIPAFETGGLVGGGPRIIQVNERGREFVINANATLGNEDDLYRLQYYLSQGTPLRDLLPGFAAGGLVDRLSSPPLYRAPLGSTQVATPAHGNEDRRDRQIERLINEVVRMKQEPARVVVGGRAARDITRLADREAQIKRAR